MSKPICSKFDCSQPATHQIVIHTKGGDIERHPRCKPCGKGDLKMLAKLGYMLPPGAEVSLEKAS